MDKNIFMRNIFTRDDKYKKNNNNKNNNSNSKSKPKKNNKALTTKEKNSNNFFRKSAVTNNNNKSPKRIQKKQLKSTRSNSMKEIQLKKDYIFDPQKDNEFYENNICSYEHLLKNNNVVTNSMIDWSMSLRSCPKIYRNKEFFNITNKKFGHIMPPKFYEDDLEKHKKKQMMRCNSAYSFPNSTFRKYRYLTQVKGSEPLTTNSFNFASTLRTYKPKQGVFVNNKQWNDMTIVSNRPKTSSIKEGSRFEKYLVRPYSIERDKVQVGNEMIKRRFFIQNKKETFEWTGEHINALPYNDYYSERNYSNLYELVNERGANIPGCKFMLGLRSNFYYSKDNKNNNNKNNDNNHNVIKNPLIDKRNQYSKQLQEQNIAANKLKLILDKK